MDPKLFEELEKKVSHHEGSYPGLKAEALLTSEEDFKAIFQNLTIDSWCELGSGYGLGTLLFSELYPQRLSLGIEFELARVQYAQEQARNENSSARFIHADLLNCEIPQAQTYFFYFPTGPVLDRILHVLGNRSDEMQLVVVESHGDFLKRLELENWLTPVKEITLKTPRHYDKAVVFKKVAQKKASLFDLSFQEKYLLIQDQRGQWLGDSQGLEYFDRDSFQLKFPSRTILQSHVVKVLGWEDIPEKLHPYLLERRQLGLWRKLYLYPEVLGEKPDGSFNKLV